MKKEFRPPEDIIKPLRTMRKWARAGIKNEPPKIILKGWWWKRFIPKYRRQEFLMNWWIKKEWSAGLWKKYLNRINKELLKR